MGMFLSDEWAWDEHWYKERIKTLEKENQALREELAEISAPRVTNPDAVEAREKLKLPSRATVYKLIKARSEQLQRGEDR